MSGPEFVLDVGRAERIGFAEAVYAGGKSAAQIEAILERAAGQGMSLLLTRLDAARLADLPAHQRERLDHDPVSRTAFFGEPAPVKGPALTAVVCAGTSDVPVAREAARTLRFYGEAALEVADVGVAGLWRLMARIEEIRAMPVVIVAAGMDAALPSVVGGLVPGLVLAVPTSVGYGVAEGGKAALGSVLASCAPGIAAFNVDNGYGAACAALRALRALRASEGSPGWTGAT